MTSDPVSAFTIVIFIVRALSAILGAAFSAIVTRIAFKSWHEMRLSQRWGTVMCLVYGYNITLFVSLILASSRPAVPGSLIYVGFILSFLAGFKMIQQSSAEDYKDDEEG